MRNHTTWITRTLWASALIAGTLSSAACKKEEDAQTTRQPTAEDKVEQAQRESERAYGKAREAQETAREQAGEAASAEEEAVDQKQEAAEAARKAEMERQEALQAQQQAQQQGAQAQQQAQSAQERAAQAQRQAAEESEQAAEGLRADTTTQPAPSAQSMATAEGVVRTASGSTLVIERDNAPALQFEVDPRSTTVLKDGEPADLAELTAGSKVTVSYRTDGDASVAQRIEVE